ncbi:MAG: sugar ABC transporter ATP-binding protein, partial [Alphaproteobacteria bacterium]
AARLTGAQMQMIEIAKALYWHAKIIIMDEPTAALGLDEARALHKVIRDLAKVGVSVIYISHALEEALELAHNVTVLRDGHVVACRAANSLTREELVHMMVGRHVGIVERPVVSTEAGEGVLQVEDLSWGRRVRNASFTLRRGEIVGLAGLVGSGRSELAWTLCGLARPTAGIIRVRGRPVKLHSPRAALRNGIAYLSENRKDEGLFLQLSLITNLTISVIGRITGALGLVIRQREVSEAKELMERFAIMATSPKAKMQTLSGGNQQRTLIARLVNTNPDILIFDEPTKGVDVGAIEAIHKTIRDLAAEGKAVLVISSYLPEVMALSDRVIVMRSGEIVANLSSAEVTEDKVVAAAFG